MKVISHRLLRLAMVVSLAFSSGCIPTNLTVGGTISGATGPLTLSLNGTETLVIDQSGPFIFTSSLGFGTSYEVSVKTPPSRQRCTVTNGSRKYIVANVTDVDITCAYIPPVISHVWPGSVLGGYEVKVSGSYLDQATVAYNGEAMTPTLQTSNEIRFIAPELPKGAYALELENSNGFTSRTVNQGEVTTGVVSMDAGHFHSCTVLPDGSVQCWGRNDYGQLGNGTSEDSATPVTVLGLGMAVAVTTGGEHSCALLQNRSVQCWGRNDYGQLGNRSTSSYSLTPVVVIGLSTAVSVTAGDRHSCAVLQGASVQCWGDNRSGQLGIGSTSNSNTSPVTVSGINTATSVTAGGDHSCAVLQTGSMRCWGNNGHGQLGNNGVLDSATPVTVAGISTALSVTAGFIHTCAVLRNGSVQCWGWNNEGELGNGKLGAYAGSRTPVAVSGIATALSLTAGQYHTCAVLQDHSTRCWGDNSDGQLGNGSTTKSATPVKVSGLGAAKSVSAGYDYSCALLQNGAVQCWGRHYYGQLGNGSGDSTTPVTISGISTAMSAAAGGSFSCALLRNGSLQCWGWNGGGQLGNGSTFFDSLAPVWVTGIDTAVLVSAGYQHSCAVLQDASIQCWGSNIDGGLGIGSYLSSLTPVKVSGISTAISASAGRENSCAVLQDGSVRCWGLNGYGQLGNGGTRQSNTPVIVTGIDTAVAITTGGFHSCALLQDGSVQCWGRNGSGQLGNGSTSFDNSTPVKVTGISTAESISAGVWHSCAVLQDGSVQCWGSNSYGQLGDSTTTDSSMPVAVIGLRTAVSVSVGTDYSCAVLLDRGVKCWGRNNYGQLGDGTIRDRHIPVAVVGISDAASVTVSVGHSCVTMHSGNVQCWGTSTLGELVLPGWQQYLPGLPVYLP